MLTDEQRKKAALYLCKERHVDSRAYPPWALDGLGSITYEEAFAGEIRNHELLHEVMGLATEQSQFVIKGGDGGTAPGERGGDVNVTLVAPLDAMEALKARANDDRQGESNEST